MATFTETLIEELDAWEKVIVGNARLIARQILTSQLGPIVLTPSIGTDQHNEEFYGIGIDTLSASFHSN